MKAGAVARSLSLLLFVALLSLIACSCVRSGEEENERQRVGPKPPRIAQMQEERRKAGEYYQPSQTLPPGHQELAQAGKLKVGLVLSVAGRGDKSFNDGAIAGLTRAAQEMGVDSKTVEPKQLSESEEALRRLAQDGYNPVIAIGTFMKDPLVKVANEFPKTYFALVDEEMPAGFENNVASFTFRSQEAAYLAGVLAADLTKTGRIGFIGGMDIPQVRQFEVGYREGARAQRTGIIIESAYIGSDPSAFNDPTKAKELALAQYQKGVDIIFQASGASYKGVFNAAVETGNFAIGVDSNQDSLAPGAVITSVLKRVDVAVYTLISEVAHGKFAGGHRSLGLKEDGVGLTDMSVYGRMRPFPGEYVKDVDRARKMIESGEIQVTDVTAERPSTPAAPAYPPKGE
jgi:basic membrane protein A